MIGYDTDDYFQLKKAIEILIRQGKLGRYVQGRMDNFRPQFDKALLNEQREIQEAPIDIKEEDFIGSIL